MRPVTFREALSADMADVSGECEQAMRSFPRPAMLIGSYRSFPLSSPFLATVRFL